MRDRNNSVRGKALVLGALALVAAVVASVAWASDLFSDVPAASPHHDDVNALAGAGITNGCAPGLYCPDQAVRRDQMASFLRRGGTRSAFGSAFQSVDLPTNTTDEAAVVTVPITVGLPASALAGAAGFVQATAEVRVDLTSAVGCPCTFRAALIDVATQGYIDGLFYARVVLNTNHATATIPITGRARYTTPGEKSIAVVVGRDVGTGTGKASANLSLTYAPFGHDGTNEATGAAPLVKQKKG